MFSSQVSQLDASPHFAPSYRTAAARAAAATINGDDNDGTRGSPRGRTASTLAVPAPIPPAVACLSAGLDGTVRAWPLINATAPTNDSCDAETAVVAAGSAPAASSIRGAAVNQSGLPSSSLLLSPPLPLLQPLPPVMMLGTPQLLRLSSGPSTATATNVKTREERIAGLAVRRKDR